MEGSDTFEQAIRLREEGNLDEAIQLMEELRIGKSRTPTLLAALGHTYQLNGNQQLAISIFREATELEPRSELLSLSLFHALWQEDQIKAALAEARRFLELEDSQDYRGILAELHEKWVGKG